MGRDQGGLHHKGMQNYELNNQVLLTSQFQHMNKYEQIKISPCPYRKL